MSDKLTPAGLPILNANETTDAGLPILKKKAEPEGEIPTVPPSDEQLNSQGQSQDTPSSPASKAVELSKALAQGAGQPPKSSQEVHDIVMNFPLFGKKNLTQIAEPMSESEKRLQSVQGADWRTQINTYSQTLNNAYDKHMAESPDLREPKKFAGTTNKDAYVPGSVESLSFYPIKDKGGNIVGFESSHATPEEMRGGESAVKNVEAFQAKSKIAATNTLKAIANAGQDLETADPIKLFQNNVLQKAGSKELHFEQEKAASTPEANFELHQNALEYKMNLLKNKVDAVAGIIGGDKLKQFNELVDAVSTYDQAKDNSEEANNARKQLQTAIQSNRSIAEYVRASQAMGEVQKEFVGLKDRPEFKTIKETEERKDNMQKYMDAYAKVDPAGAWRMGRSFHFLNAISKMGSGMVGFINDVKNLKSDNKYDFVDALADNVHALSDRYTLPTPSNEKTALHEKQVEYNGVLIHADGDGNITRISDTKGYDIDPKKAQEVADQFKADPAKPKFKDVSNYGLMPVKVADFLADMAVMVEGGKGIGKVLGTGAKVNQTLALASQMHDDLYKEAYEKFKGMPDAEEKAARYTTAVNLAMGSISLFNPVIMGMHGAESKWAASSFTKNFFKDYIRKNDAKLLANMTKTDMAQMIGKYLEDGVKNGLISGTDMAIMMKVPTAIANNYMNSKYGTDFNTNQDLNSIKEEFELAFATAFLPMHGPVTKPDFQRESVVKAVANPEKFNVLLDKLVADKAMTAEQATFHKERIAKVAEEMANIDFRGDNPEVKALITDLVDATVQAKMRKDKASNETTKALYEEQEKKANEELKKAILGDEGYLQEKLKGAYEAGKKREEVEKKGDFAAQANVNALINKARAINETLSASTGYFEHSEPSEHNPINFMPKEVERAFTRIDKGDRPDAPDIKAADEWVTKTIEETKSNRLLSPEERASTISMLENFHEDLINSTKNAGEEKVTIERTKFGEKPTEQAPEEVAPVEEETPAETVGEGGKEEAVATEKTVVPAEGETPSEPPVQAKPKPNKRKQELQDERDALQLSIDNDLIQTDIEKEQVQKQIEELDNQIASEPDMVEETATNVTETPESVAETKKVVTEKGYSPETHDKFEQLDQMRDELKSEEGNKKILKREINKFLEANPDIKAVDENFSKITKALMERGELAKSSPDCP